MIPKPDWSSPGKRRSWELDDGAAIECWSPGCGGGWELVSFVRVKGQIVGVVTQAIPRSKARDILSALAGPDPWWWTLAQMARLEWWSRADECEHGQLPIELCEACEPGADYVLDDVTDEWLEAER